MVSLKKKKRQSCKNCIQGCRTQTCVTGWPASPQVVEQPVLRAPEQRADLLQGRQESGAGGALPRGGTPGPETRHL